MAKLIERRFNICSTFPLGSKRSQLRGSKLRAGTHEPFLDSQSSTDHPRRCSDNAVKAPTGPPPMINTFRGREPHRSAMLSQSFSLDVVVVVQGKPNDSLALSSRRSVSVDDANHVRSLKFQKFVWLGIPKKWRASTGLRWVLRTGSL